MLERTRRALRLGYLVGRAVVHGVERPGQEFGAVITPTGKTALGALDYVIKSGHELEVVLYCESCRTVAIVDHRNGAVRQLAGNPPCPIATAWRAVLARPLPRARERVR